MGIPERILPRVMRSPPPAGLSRRRTGRTGGYRTHEARLDTITLLDVIAAAEPTDEDRRCVLRGSTVWPGRSMRHPRRHRRGRAALDERLAETTLADLDDPHRTDR